MEKAGIERQHPRYSETRYKPRVFHSFRHSFTMVCLEKGYHEEKIRNLLGQSQLVDAYKHFEYEMSRDDKFRIEIAA